MAIAIYATGDLMQYRIGDRDPVTGLYEVIHPDGSTTPNGIKIFNAAHKVGDPVSAIERSDGKIYLDGQQAFALDPWVPDGERDGYLKGQVWNRPDEGGITGRYIVLKMRSYGNRMISPFFFWTSLPFFSNNRISTLNPGVRIAPYSLGRVYTGYYPNQRFFANNVLISGNVVDTAPTAVQRVDFFEFDLVTLRAASQGDRYWYYYGELSQDYYYGNPSGYRTSFNYVNNSSYGFYNYDPGFVFPDDFAIFQRSASQASLALNKVSLGVNIAPYNYFNSATDYNTLYQADAKYRLGDKTIRWSHARHASYLDRGVFTVRFNILMCRTKWMIRLDLKDPAKSGWVSLTQIDPAVNVSGLEALTYVEPEWSFIP